MVNQVHATKVATALAPLCDLYGTPRDEALNIYVRVLGEYSAETLIKAVDAVLGTYAAKGFPAPAVIKKACDEMPVPVSERKGYEPPDARDKYPEACEQAMLSHIGQQALKESLGNYVYSRSMRTGEMPDYTWLDDARSAFKKHMRMVTQLSWAATVPKHQGEEDNIRVRSGEYAGMDKVMAQTCLSFAKAIEHRERALYDQYYRGGDKKPLPGSTKAASPNPDRSNPSSPQNP